MSGSEGKPGQKTGFFGRMFRRTGDADKTVETDAGEPVGADATDATGADLQTDSDAAASNIAAAADGIAEPQAADLPADEPAAGEPEKPRSWLQRLTGGLAKTSRSLTSGITAIFSQGKLNADAVQDLEDLLISSDLGVDMATRITDAISAGRYDRSVTADEVRRVLSDEVRKVLEPVAQPLAIDTAQSPHVILVVGVNGAGKTTTIGKLAAQFRAEGRTVMLAAGDTFRAAAVDQLKIWGERTGAPVVTRDLGADASGLAFDALKQAKDAGTDVLMIDTAGRLQNKAELMDELDKVLRVLKKIEATAPHSVLLVLDATTGQNAISQVGIFSERCGVTGLVMTKLDGTARGGILVAIAAKYGLPVHAIGVGEGVEDLAAFDARQFADALATGSPTATSA